MREIKFRAWNKKHEKLANVTGIFFDKDIVFLDIPAEGVELDQNMKAIRRFKSQESWRLSDTELMQYTGLKDKNGKEIYEGDIVEFSGYKRDWREVVKWENIAKHTSFGGGTHNAMIIGNIYENPELLKP